jgi:hypothetical protein
MSSAKQQHLEIGFQSNMHVFVSVLLALHVSGSVGIYSKTTNVSNVQCTPISHYPKGR